MRMGLRPRFTRLHINKQVSPGHFIWIPQLADWNHLPLDRHHHMQLVMVSMDQGPLHREFLANGRKAQGHLLPDLPRIHILIKGQLQRDPCCRQVLMRLNLKHRLHFIQAKVMSLLQRFLQTHICLLLVDHLRSLIIDLQSLHLASPLSVTLRSHKNTMLRLTVLILDLHALLSTKSPPKYLSKHSCRGLVTVPVIRRGWVSLLPDQKLL
jgi:hypothetical protein